MNQGTRFTTAAVIHEKVERLWTQGRLLASTLDTEPRLFPLTLRLASPSARALSEQFDDVRRWIRELEGSSKVALGFGYEIVWEDINHRQLGRNRVPVAVVIPTAEDALALIGKRSQAQRFMRLASLTLVRFEELRGWLAKNPFVVLELEREWERVLAVVAWFRDHPRPGVYLRQLEIASVHTKLIESRKGLFAELLDLTLPHEAVCHEHVGARQFEQRYGLRTKPPLIRFRVLDSALHMGGLSDITTPISQFATLELDVEHVFVTENEINGLAFPPHAKSIVVFGLGYGVDLLAQAPWLRAARVHYWGDIDTHGFAILDRLRSHVPSVSSFLMDCETLLAHRELWTEDTDPCSHDLPRLTLDEGALYRDLVTNVLGARVRLEQERVAFDRVERAVGGTPRIR